MERHLIGMECIGGGSFEVLVKGAGHKYIKRVATGKEKPKWRYIYNVQKKGVVTDTDLHEGAKFKTSTKGGHDQGHFHVLSAHKDDSGNVTHVTIKHDENGEEKTVSVEELKNMVHGSLDDPDKPRMGDDSRQDVTLRSDEAFNLYNMGEFDKMRPKHIRAMVEYTNKVRRSDLENLLRHATPGDEKSKKEISWARSGIISSVVHLSNAAKNATDPKTKEAAKKAADKMAEMNKKDPLLVDDVDALIQRYQSKGKKGSKKVKKSIYALQSEISKSRNQI